MLGDFSPVTVWLLALSAEEGCSRSWRAESGSVVRWNEETLRRAEVVCLRCLRAFENESSDERVSSRSSPRLRGKAPKGSRLLLAVARQMAGAKLPNRLGRSHHRVDRMQESGATGVLACNGRS